MQSLRAAVSIAVLAGVAFCQPAPRILSRFGSTGPDAGRGVGADAAGNIFVASTFTGTASFNPAGGGNLTSAGQTDIALAKYSPQGDLLFVTRIGGAGAETVGGFYVDPAGTIYLGGSFSGTVNFDPFGTNPRSALGGRDAFVAQYSPDGRFRWVVVFSGARDDEAVDVSVDRDGNVAVACITRSTTIDSSPTGGNPLTLAGPVSGFVTVLDSSARFINTPVVANGDDDGFFGLAVTYEPGGMLYIGGAFTGVIRFDNDTAYENLLSRNLAFIAAYWPDRTLRFAFPFGGPGSDSVASGGMAADTDAVYVAGTFEGTAFVDRRRMESSIQSAGGKDIFLLKYNKVGDVLWAHSLGGPLDDYPRRLRADGVSLLFLAGAFRGTASLAPRPTSQVFTAKGLQGATDAFCGKYSAGDGSFIWVNSLGDANTGADKITEATGITPDVNGYVACTGRFYGAPVVEPDGVNTTLTSAGDADIFLLRYDPNGRFEPKVVPPPPPKPVISAILSNAAGVAGGLAPGGIHSLYGDNLTEQAAWVAPAYPLQTSACGLTVKITDAAQRSVNAPLYYCSKTQINFIAPSTLARGAAKVETSGASFDIMVGEATPALYDPAIIFAAGAKAGSVVSATNRADPGDVLTSFCTGLGVVLPALASDTTAVAALHTTQLPVTATAGGQSVNVLFAGLTPGFAGLYQVNFIVPAGLTGKQSFQVKAGPTLTSNAVDLWLR